MTLRCSLEAEGGDTILTTISISAACCTGLALVSAGMYAWGRRGHVHDPRLVRLAQAAVLFAAASTALLLAGMLLR